MVNFNPFKKSSKSAKEPAKPAANAKPPSIRSGKSVKDELSGYEIGQHLGSGGFGVVRQVHEIGQAEGIDIAMKAVPLTLIRQNFGDSHSDVMKTRLERMRQFNDSRHPHIIRLIDYRIGAKDLFIFLELCRGKDLFERIVNAPGGRLKEEDVRKAARNLCSAVAHCHKMGLVHRDIKPENVFYRNMDAPLEDVVLADFSCMLDGMKPDSKMTGLAGSPGYVAPEMAAKQEYTMIVDEFGLGVTIYECLTGRSPFKSDNEEALREEVIHRAIPYPRQYWSTVSEEARDFVSKLLEKDPAKRMTAEQAQFHPWLANDKPISKGVSTTSDDSDASSTPTRRPTRTSISRGLSFYRPEPVYEGAGDSEMSDDDQTRTYDVKHVLTGNVPANHLSQLHNMDQS